MSGAEVIFKAEPGLGLAPGWVVERQSVRARGELRVVLADPPAAAPDDAVAYWMADGVGLGDGIEPHPALRFELTLLDDRPYGREAPKTVGHVHVAVEPARLGHAEVCQVLAGRVTFVLHDVSWADDDLERLGRPAARACWVVRADPGDIMILPPVLHHLAVGSSPGRALFSDVVSRRTALDASGMRTAGGAPVFVDLDGGTRPNHRYHTIPRPVPMSTAEWNGVDVAGELKVGDDLFGSFRTNPDSYAWLDAPDTFPEMFPVIWGRIQRELEK